MLPPRLNGGARIPQARALAKQLEPLVVAFADARGGQSAVRQPLCWHRRGGPVTPPNVAYLQCGMPKAWADSCPDMPHERDFIRQVIARNQSTDNRFALARGLQNDAQL